MIPRAITKRLLTVKEASEYLGISVRQLEYLYYKGFIAQTRLPETKKRLYDIFELDFFIDKNKQNGFEQ